MQRPSSPSVRISYPRCSREGLIRMLRERLPLLAERLPLVRVVLFGSWAAGRVTRRPAMWISWWSIKGTREKMPSAS